MPFSSFRASAALGVIAAGVMLAACSDKPVPPCPPVRVDRDTAQLVQFRDGSSRDQTNVDYAVQLIGYDGQCAFKDEGVDVTIDLSMDLIAGPAAKGGSVEIPYFVALPQFFPAPEGKQILAARRGLPSRTGVRDRLEEKGIHVFIPLKKDQPAAAFDIYVGFQLTPDQLEYNRSQNK